MLCARFLVPALSCESWDTCWERAPPLLCWGSCSLFSRVVFQMKGGENHFHSLCRRPCRAALVRDAVCGSPSTGLREETEHRTALCAGGHPPKELLSIRSRRSRCFRVKTLSFTSKTHRSSAACHEGQHLLTHFLKLDHSSTRTLYHGAGPDVPQHQDTQPPSPWHHSAMPCDCCCSSAQRERRWICLASLYKGPAARSQFEERILQQLLYLRVTRGLRCLS